MSDELIACTSKYFTDVFDMILPAINNRISSNNDPLTIEELLSFAQLKKEIVRTETKIAKKKIQPQIQIQTQEVFESEKNTVDDEPGRCNYRFIRGRPNTIGSRCPEVIVEGTLYCKTCIKKKGVMKLLESTNNNPTERKLETKKSVENVTDTNNISLIPLSEDIYRTANNLIVHHDENNVLWLLGKYVEGSADIYPVNDADKAEARQMNIYIKPNIDFSKVVNSNHKTAEDIKEDVAPPYSASENTEAVPENIEAVAEIILTPANNEVIEKEPEPEKFVPLKKIVPKRKNIVRPPPIKNQS